MNIKLLKLFVSIILLLCLFDMPYVSYQFTRFTLMAVFTYLAYFSNEQNNKQKVFIYTGLAILFQPFEKFAFGKIIWNLIDIVIVLFLLLSLLKTNDKISFSKLITK